MTTTTANLADACRQKIDEAYIQAANSLGARPKSGLMTDPEIGDAQIIWDAQAEVAYRATTRRLWVEAQSDEMLKAVLTAIDEHNAGLFERPSDLAVSVMRKAGSEALSEQGNDLQTVPASEHANVVAYFDAHCTDEYASGPEFAKVIVDEVLMKRVLSMQALCKEHGLSEVRTFASTDAWGPGDVESEARLLMHELVVTQNYFWFRADAKNSNFAFETELEQVDTFADKISKATKGVPLYFGSDAERHESVQTWQLELGGNEPPCLAVDEDISGLQQRMG